MRFKYYNWKWKIYKAFSLNISFTYFNLKYSGEACLQERIIIKSRHNVTIGRYCGRRYQWSVFVRMAPIILKYHTFGSSKSWFELQYELTDINITSYIMNYKIYREFKIIENKYFVFPFGWINKYLVRNHNYYNWNIFVTKMNKLFLKIMKHSNSKNIFYLYDGPDYHCDEYDLTYMASFTSSSFQVSILLYSQYDDIELKVNSYLFKEKIQNYQIYSVENRTEIISTNLKCVKDSIFLCVFKFIVYRNLHVNITLSFKYLGPNIGYCKYGGLSVYDYVNSTIKEVLLSCNNWFSQSLNLQPNITLVSTTEHSFLVFYSYMQYSEIEFQLQIETSSCKGVITQR